MKELDREKEARREETWDREARIEGHQGTAEAGALAGTRHAMPETSLVSPVPPPFHFLLSVLSRIVREG